MLLIIASREDACHLQELLPWKRLGFSDALALQEYTEVPKKAADANGIILIWDTGLPESPVDFCRLLKGRKIPCCVLLMAPEETVSVLRTGMELRASAVLPTDCSAEYMETIMKAAIEELQQKRITAIKVRAFRQLRNALVGGAMRGMLQHSPNQLDMEMLQELKMIPDDKKNCWLILLDIVNYQDHPEMERTMFSVAICNIAQEVFQPADEMVNMCWMSASVFGCFLQNRSGQEPDKESIAEYLRTIRRYLGQYLDWQVTMYVSPPVRLRETPAVWVELNEFRKQNISQVPGVFHLEDRPLPSDRESPNDVSVLRQFLMEGYADLLESEANRCLMAVMNSGHASRKALQNFYLEFMKLINSVMWEKKWDASELFPTEKDIELMNTAPDSVANMTNLIHHVAEYFRVRYADRNTKNAAQMVCQYISEHYAEPISRDSLAEYIHLNPDYLTRIFRRETGMTLKDYIIKKRMEAAQMLLRSTTLRINEISEMVGYSNYSYFTQNYHRQFGISPKQETRSSNLKP